MGGVGGGGGGWGWFFFFFKQKTAYEIYQCDWSSDVCSSDLCCHHGLSVQYVETEVPQATIRAILGSVTVCVLLDLFLLVIVGVSFR